MFHYACETFIIPRGHFVPEGGYRNTFRPCVRPSVRPRSYLRDGSWDHYETLGHHKVLLWDDARHFEKIQDGRLVIEKLGQKWPFSPILAHFMLYLCQNGLD